MNIGSTLTVFIKSGTLPHSIDLLTMIEIVLATLWNIKFNNIELSLSLLQLFFYLSALSFLSDLNSEISQASVRLMKNVFWFLLLCRVMII